MRWEIEFPQPTMELIDKTIDRVLFLTMNDIVNDIVEHCPVDTGLTRNTVRGEVRDRNIIIHAGGAMYYIEYGTPPHTIRPKLKKALHWEGADHPVKVVHHPGTRPNPIVRSAMHRGLLEYLPMRFNQEIDRLWAG